MSRRQAFMGNIYRNHKYKVISTILTLVFIISAVIPGVMFVREKKTISAIFTFLLPFSSAIVAAIVMGAGVMAFETSDSDIVAGIFLTAWVISYIVCSSMAWKAAMKKDPNGIFNLDGPKKNSY